MTVPQLCIRYTLQLGTVSLPKTANPEHMRSNAEVDFDDLRRGHGRAARPATRRTTATHSAFPVYQESEGEPEWLRK